MALPPGQKPDADIRVHEYIGAYIATWRGKRASCTAGPMRAAEAVAKKVLGHDDFGIAGGPDRRHAALRRWRYYVCRVKGACP